MTAELGGRRPDAPRPPAGTRLALLLAAWLGLLTLPGSAPATSLRFFGTGEDGIDRVTIQIDPHKPADVGATDFTLEWWMKADEGGNDSEAAACDTNDGWILGNILFDRDVYGPGDHGDYGVSLSGGRIAFGVSAGLAGNTICGETVVADGAWHHVAVTRQRSSGRLRIYVDGVLDAEGAGNVGSNADVSYENGRATDHEFDPYLVIGAEKHDADPSIYPSYRGWIDEVRLSTTERYTGSRFTRPFSPFSSEASTAALYHLDEGTGDAIGDASGGGSVGLRRVGGDPAGPEWSSETAPLDSARRVALEEVITGAGRTVSIANAGDDRLFVVDANGRILVYQVGEEVPFESLGTYLDIQGRVACCGERGLLGLAFHPSFATNRYFFVYYTRESDGDVVIARYRAPTASSNLVDPSTERILLTIDHSTFGNHNGGGIAFGPDGYLYVPVGDGGGGGDPFGSGQNVTTHLGKLLRLAVDVSDGGGAAPYYTIPPDNPFATSSGSQKKEIWAWGLRNPWRISFDRLTGDLFIADVGQDSREEVNLQLAGSTGGVNYGWPRMEGIACFNPGSGCQTGSLTLPILDYSHGEGCSITGGYRYRGQGIPTLHGVYVFGDFCSKRIWAGVQSGSGGWGRTTLLNTGLSISSFGEDAAGELYVAHVGGSVHRFVRVRPRLTVMKAGNGAGTVTGPGALACGASCSVELEPGQLVTLTASPGGTSWLAGWSGGCGGTGGCAVLMDGDRSVTATFSLRPVFQFSAPSYSVNENSGSAMITVQRLGTTAGTATVDYAVEPGSATPPPAADADFSPSGGAGPLTGTLTFPPGQSTRSFTIPIVDDALVEGSETILLSLHNPTAGALLGAQPTVVLTIVDDDRAGTAQFSKATATAQEFASSVTLMVTRTGPTGSAASVPYHLAGKVTGVDTALTPLDGTVDFEPGQSGVPLVINLLNDPTQDGNAALTATLDTPSSGDLALGTPKLATVTLVDYLGTVQFAQPTFTVGEARGSATIALTRVGGTTRPTTVHFATGGGAEDSATPSASSGSCSPGADYRRIVDGSLTFNPGETSRTFTVQLCGDSVVESPDPETLTLRLLSVSAPATMGAQSTAVLGIQDNDGGGTVRFSSGSYSVTEGTPTATLTVLRASGAGNVTVPWTLGGSAILNTDYEGPTSGELEFGPKQTSASLPIRILNDTLIDGLKNLVVILGAPSGGATLGSPSVATLGIGDNEPSVRFSSAVYNVSESSSSVGVTVMRDGSTGSTVTLQVKTTTGGTATAGTCGSGADFTAVTVPVTFTPGQTSRTVTIPLCSDTGVEELETIALVLDNVTGATSGTPSAATIKIAENDVAGAAQFAVDASSVSETQGTANVQVTRAGGSASGLEVHWTITGGTAVHDGAPGPGIDYTGATSGVVVFELNEISRSIQVPVGPRTGSQGPRSVTLVLDGAAGGGTLGARTTTTLWILDADLPESD